jgi:endonuclease/exonuclease/phosphatase family metal-dependent hydrolase
MFAHLLWPAMARFYRLEPRVTLRPWASSGKVETLRISVATYNVHGCVGADGRFDPGRVLRVLRALDADVIALQELRWRPDEALHVLADLAGRMEYTALAGSTLMRPDGHYGNALLTRLPVLATLQVDLSVPGREPRGALQATLRAGAGTLDVIATHLGLGPGERRTQMRHVLGLVNACAKPVVLMGDLNEWFLWGRPLRRLHRYFKATPSVATFPAMLPLLALDRVWTHPRSLLKRIRVHTSPLARVASDHLPLVATLEI